MDEIKHWPVELVDNSDTQTLQEIYFFRKEVCLEEGWITPEEFPDGVHDKHDPDAFHFIVKDNGAIVGAARIAVINALEEYIGAQSFDLVAIPTEYAPIAVFSRNMAARSHRNEHVAGSVINAREEFAMQHQFPLFLVITHDHLVVKYEQEGFQDIGQGDDAGLTFMKTHGNRVLIKINRER